MQRTMDSQNRCQLAMAGRFAGMPAEVNPAKDFKAVPNGMLELGRQALITYRFLG